MRYRCWDVKHYALFSGLILATVPAFYIYTSSVPETVAVGVSLIMMVFLSRYEVPLFSWRTKNPAPSFGEIEVLEKLFFAPVSNGVSKSRVFETSISLNAGGFILPLILSLYLVTRDFDMAFLEIAAIMVILTYFLSDFIDNIGVSVPQYIGLFALPLAHILAPENAAVVVFTGGFVGIVLGVFASIISMNRERQGSAYLCIGGVGSFQAVFVTALLAVVIGSVV